MNTTKPINPVRIQRSRASTFDMGTSLWCKQTVVQRRTVPCGVRTLRQTQRPGGGVRGFLNCPPLQPNTPTAGAKLAGGRGSRDPHTPNA